MIADLGLYTLTIAAVSFTPGLCMALAFTLGMTVGYRKTLWMMAGEMTGLATVFTATFWSLSWLLEQSPAWFSALSALGGAYLMFLAVALFRQPAVAIKQIEALSTRPLQLAALGFATAFGNPKGWAFLMALLPGFLDERRPLPGQYVAMLAIMMLTEFLSMSLYAGGGSWLAARVSGGRGLAGAHRVAAVMLAAVSLWVLAGAVGL
ncbi:MAG: LysE family translocator [Planctomycetota bacterium]